MYKSLLGRKQSIRGAKNFFESLLLKRTKLKRTVFFVSIDGLLLALSLYLSFYLRFEGNIGSEYTEKFSEYLLVFLTVKYTIFSVFRFYRMTWSYVGFYELLDILKATVSSLILLYGIVFILWPLGVFKGFPRSILAIDFIISLIVISMFRTSKRFFEQTRNGDNPKDNMRTLIVGAGNTGEQIARAMRRQANSMYNPVGFIDDDAMKHGNYIHGIKVYGSRKDIMRLTEKLNLSVILLAIPSAPSRDIRDIFFRAQRSSAKEVKTISGLNGMEDREYSLSDIKNIRIEDIIGREQVSIDKTFVTDFIRGKKILITGAGGSIGSELVRQALSFKPKKIIALDIDETELHRIEMEFNQFGHIDLVTVLADIRDKYKIDTVFNEYLPNVVFHAAAYKHVYMLERYPEEAVRVNIMGTRIVAEAALAYGAEKFILVSTDKAVKPTNIMGASKRVAEKVVSSLNSLLETKFISVRFGNVVGSRGSVIPIFEEQIKKGGPVTVTHHDMKRYFMSIPEACILILQAAAMGRGGEVFLLDMGDQIKILDIAREMIRLNGLEPDIDIPIVFTGARPGEKLYEELLADTEDAEPTEHPKIFVGKNRYNNDVQTLQKVELFEEQLLGNKWTCIKNMLVNIVPSYNPWREENSLPQNNTLDENVSVGSKQ